MGKLRSFDFNFVPMPEEIWDECIPLSLSEFRFLGYLCKQIRFGEALKPITDEEMMHGVLEKGKRKDQGCGLLSRNGIKQAREALAERGWIEAINVSNDPTRPRWNYRLLLGTKGETATVSARQLVSQRDTVTARQVVSHDDSAVSQHDSGSVTARQQVSSADTCNKEEESTKNLDKELERSKAEIKPAPISQYAQTAEQRQKQANLDSWDLRRWQEAMRELEPSREGSVGRHVDDADAEWRANAKRAAFVAGIMPARIVGLLKQHFPNDKNIDLLYPEHPQLFPQQPQQPKPQPAAESEEEIRRTIERSMPALSRESA
jgi:hypothetical protein